MIRIGISISLVFLCFIGLSQLNHNLIKDKTAYSIDFNSRNHEMSPVRVDGGIAYVLFKQKSKDFEPTRGERSFDIVVNFDGSLEPLSLSENINSDYPEGPFAFYGDHLYFTRTSSEKAKKVSKRALPLKIYESYYEDGVWYEPELVKFPTGDFNYCHPTLSADGQMMIFSSDLPGGFGKMDLYVSYLRNGEWSKPENLGAEVNTSGNELFPFFHNDQYLYFASNGFEESTDLDIYEAAYRNDAFKNTIKLSTPINSDQDDFGLSINAEGTEVLFSSSRPGKGKDDIYQILFEETINKVFTPDQVVFSIQMIDDRSKKRLPKKEVKIIPLVLADFGMTEFNEQKILKEAHDVNTTAFVIKTNEKGEQLFTMDTKTKYILIIDIPGYKESRFIYDPLQEEHEWLISMQPIAGSISEKKKPRQVEKEIVSIRKPQIVIPQTKGAEIVFDNIYYEYNSAVIRQEAAGELDALFLAMHENPFLKVELSAHTDSRGESAYNLELSEKRAASAKSYLTSKGISSTRIISKGFGETRIRNHCRESVPCNETDHRFNRRTEVKILEI